MGMTSPGQWRKNQQTAIDEESKVDFKGMKFEYEYELAMAMRAFINARIFGLDYLDSAMAIIENKIVDAYKDEQYSRDIEQANTMLSERRMLCRSKKGFDYDKYNQAVHDNIMARYKAVNELLFRKNMAPQLAEYGVLD
ncbi:MAG: hypothetical protein FJY76_04025 [Candidatus Aenigmarchaeota archaeon]|nr:hypothetical protein [Candidatus Aenigmarchaeota archaeon]